MNSAIIFAVMLLSLLCGLVGGVLGAWMLYDMMLRDKYVHQSTEAKEQFFSEDHDSMWRRERSADNSLMQSTNKRTGNEFSIRMPKEGAKQ